MPNYDYECPGEGKVIVLDLPMDHKIPHCQVCGAKLRRVFTAVPSIFKELDGLAKMVNFRCNFCSANTDFVWLDGYPEAEGFRVYQCLKCCAIGTKNMAEQIDTQEPVMRCNKCGSWMFADKECHTCAILMMN